MFAELRELPSSGAICQYRNSPKTSAIIRIQINFVSSVKTTVNDYFVYILFCHRNWFKDSGQYIISSVVYSLCHAFQLGRVFSASDLHRIFRSFSCKIFDWLKCVPSTILWQAARSPSCPTTITSPAIWFSASTSTT